MKGRSDQRDATRPLSRLVDQYPVAMYAYDEHFRIVDANNLGERVTGRTRSELIGMSGIDLLHVDDQALAASSVAVITGDPSRVIREGAVMRLVHTDGTVVPWDVRIEVLPRVMDGVKYVGVLAPAARTVAMDALIDSLAASDSVDVLVERVLAAVESTGNYAASVHHSRGFAGEGPMSIVLDAGVGAVIDAAAIQIQVAVEQACAAGHPTYVRFGRLGLPDEVRHRHLVLRGAAIFPFSVRGAVAGALVAWASPTDALGPFGLNIVTRIALLTGLGIERRFELTAAASTRQVGPLTIDLVERTVIGEGRSVKLTPIETAIMDLLSEIPGRPVTREQIVMRLFGSTHLGDGRASDVHIRNLRVKLRDDPGNPRFIRTVRGVGYALVDDT